MIDYLLIVNVQYDELHVYLSFLLLPFGSNLYFPVLLLCSSPKMMLMDAPMHPFIMLYLLQYEVCCNNVFFVIERTCVL